MPGPLASPADHVLPLSQDLQIMVMTLTGQTITVVANVSGTIKNVKEEIQNVVGIPIEQQRLIFADQQLEDGHTLGHYNVSPSSRLHLSLRPLEKGDMAAGQRHAWHA